MATRVQVLGISHSIDQGWTAKITVYEDVASIPTAMPDFTETNIPISGPMTWENVSQLAYDFAGKAALSRASAMVEKFGSFYPV